MVKVPLGATSGSILTAQARQSAEPASPPTSGSARRSGLVTCRLSSARHKSAPPGWRRGRARTVAPCASWTADTGGLAPEAVERPATEGEPGLSGQRSPFDRANPACGYREPSVFEIRSRRSIRPGDAAVGRRFRSACARGPDQDLHRGAEKRPLIRHAHVTITRFEYADIEATVKRFKRGVLAAGVFRAMKIRSACPTGRSKLGSFPNRAWTVVIDRAPARRLP